MTTWHRIDDPDNPLPRDGRKVWLFMEWEAERDEFGDDIETAGKSIEIGCFDRKLWRSHIGDEGWFDTDSVKMWAEIDWPEPPK